MKRTWFLFAGFSAFWAMCEHYPSNPCTTDTQGSFVMIRHVSTEYVPAQSEVEGVIANKVNVLTFELQMKNGSASGLEFYGSAVLGGPPDDREHAFLFQTDRIENPCTVPGYEFNTVDRIDPDTSYTLVRAQFPSNEYYPFDGEQGKILLVEITDAWTLDGEDVKCSPALVRAASESGP